MARITDLFLEELRHAWENVLDLKLAVERVESNPQLVQIVPPNEVVVLISFELTIGDIRGMMNLCIPFNSIERIGSKLSANSWVTYGRRNATPETRPADQPKPQGSLVELVAELAETRISTGDLIGLRVGDIITTEKDVNDAAGDSRRGGDEILRLPRRLQGSQGDPDRTDARHAASPQRQAACARAGEEVGATIGLGVASLRSCATGKQRLRVPACDVAFKRELGEM